MRSANLLNLLNQSNQFNESNDFVSCAWQHTPMKIEAGIQSPVSRSLKSEIRSQSAAADRSWN